MNLSIFQRLVLIALADILWHVGGRSHYLLLCETMRAIALGAHNAAQQEAMFEDYKRSRQ